MFLQSSLSTAAAHQQMRDETGEYTVEKRVEEEKGSQVIPILSCISIPVKYVYLILMGYNDEPKTVSSIIIH